MGIQGSGCKVKGCKAPDYTELGCRAVGGRMIAQVVLEEVGASIAKVVAAAAHTAAEAGHTAGIRQEPVTDSQHYLAADSAAAAQDMANSIVVVAGLELRRRQPRVAMREASLMLVELGWEVGRGENARVGFPDVQGCVQREECRNDKAEGREQGNEELTWLGL